MVADDGAGTLVPVLLQAYRKASLDGETVGDLAVYQTSGTLEHGHK
jgi:hypothetical protein